MEYGQYMFGQEFNKNFSDVLNCEIVAPPYYVGNVPQTFMMKKRTGFAKGIQTEVGTYVEAASSVVTDEVLDHERVELGDKVVNYFLIRSVGSTPHVYFRSVLFDPGSLPNVTVTLNQDMGAWVEGVNYKFFYMPHVKNGEGYDGTYVSGQTGQYLHGDTTTIAGEILVEEGTGAYQQSTWFSSSSSSYAGRYMYCYDFGGASAGNPTYDETKVVGVGQVLKVDYKHNDRFLVVTSGGWHVPPFDVKWEMFKEFGSVLSFIGPSYIYTVPEYDMTEHTPRVFPLRAFNDPVDCAYANGKLYAIERSAVAKYSRNVIKGAEGKNAGYRGSDTLLSSVTEAFNILQFQNYVLVISKQGIDTIGTVTTKVNNVEYKNEALANVSRDVTLYSQNSYAMYNGGLYVFTDSKQLFAMSILSENFDRYVVTLQNQGIYVQKFFDTFATGDRVQLSIQDSDIHIIRSGDNGSDGFVYSNFFKGWHRWSSELSIKRKKLNFYMGESLYEQNAPATSDVFGETVHKYPQLVSTVHGEDNLFSLKRQWFTKVLLGNQTSREAYVHMRAYGGGDVFDWNIPFTSSKWIKRLNSGTEGETLGTSLVGSLPFGISTDAATANSPVAGVKANTGFTYELAIIEVKADEDHAFELGGLMSGYDVIPAQITPIENVI